MVKYYYVFYVDGKHYDPSCLVIDSDSDKLEDVQIAIDLACAPSKSSTNGSLVVTQRDENFHVFNSEDAKHNPGGERYKLVPFNPELRYKRHTKSQNCHK